VVSNVRISTSEIAYTFVRFAISPNFKRLGSGELCARNCHRAVVYVNVKMYYWVFENTTCTRKLDLHFDSSAYVVWNRTNYTTTIIVNFFFFIIHFHPIVYRRRVLCSPQNRDWKGERRIRGRIEINYSLGLAVPREMHSRQKNNKNVLCLQTYGARFWRFNAWCTPVTHGLTIHRLTYFIHILFTTTPQ